MLEGRVTDSVGLLRFRGGVFNRKITAAKIKISHLTRATRATRVFFYSFYSNINMLSVAR